MIDAIQDIQDAMMRLRVEPQSQPDSVIIGVSKRTFRRLFSRKSRKRKQGQHDLLREMATL